LAISEDLAGVRWFRTNCRGVDVGLYGRQPLIWGYPIHGQVGGDLDPMQRLLRRLIENDNNPIVSPTTNGIQLK
jgi:hypothetical protein